MISLKKYYTTFNPLNQIYSSINNFDPVVLEISNRIKSAPQCSHNYGILSTIIKLKDSREKHMLN